MSLGSHLWREAKHLRQDEHQGHSDLLCVTHTQSPALVAWITPKITAGSCHWQRHRIRRKGGDG